MPKIKWRNFLTGRDDPTIGNVSFLSRPAEVHALGVGIIVGLTGSKAAIVGLCLYLMGRGTMRDSLPDNLHFKDALREPVYALGGLLLGVGGHVLAWDVPGWLGALL